MTTIPVKTSLTTAAKAGAPVNTARVQAVIDALRGAAPKIRSVLVARNDGLLLVQTAVEGDATRMAAMASTALSLNKRITETMGAGSLTETSITGENGLVLLYAAGPRAALAVIAETKANMAMINLKARVAAQTIAAEFGAAH